VIEYIRTAREGYGDYIFNLSSLSREVRYTTPSCPYVNSADGMLYGLKILQLMPAESTNCSHSLSTA
jgi:hypothetical protein